MVCVQEFFASLMVMKFSLTFSSESYFIVLTFIFVSVLVYFLFWVEFEILVLWLLSSKEFACIAGAAGDSVRSL